MRYGNYIFMTPAEIKADEKKLLRGLPKQAKDIVLNIGLEGEVTIKQVKEAVEKLADQGILKTNQRPLLIFTYYRASMIENGVVKHIEK